MEYGGKTLGLLNQLQMEKIYRIISHSKSIYFTLFLVVLMHLPFMNEPPRSIHVWRQTLTLAMSRNFAQEGMNILEPKVDRRYETNGITGSQFLSYEWGLAVLYKVFGFHEHIHRWWSMLFYLLIVAGFYQLIFAVTVNRVAAFAGSWMLAFSPELFYQGINAMPDILALACMIWSLVFLSRWDRSFKSKYLNLFFVCIFIAGLTKLQYFAAGVIACYIFINDWRLNRLSRKQIMHWFTGGILSIFLTFAWYLYAANLTKNSGLFEVRLMLNIETNISKAWSIIIQNLTSDLPELMMGFSSFALFVIGIVYFFKNKYRHGLAFPMAYWLILLMVFHYLVLVQMEHHQYYLLPYLPIAFTIAAFGFVELKKAIPTIAFILLMLAPILAAIRIIPARWSEGKEGVLHSFYNHETRNKISSIIPQGALTINGPDQSGCINFYFTHTKGFGYNFEGELFDTMPDGIMRIDNYISRGAEYMIITGSDKNDQEIRAYIKELMYENDELLIAKLKK
jgi:hypothetical protein